MGTGKQRTINSGWCNADAADLYWFEIDGVAGNSAHIYLPYGQDSAQADRNLDAVRMRAFANAATEFGIQVGEHLSSPGDDAVLEVVALQPSGCFIGGDRPMLRVVSGTVKERAKSLSQIIVVPEMERTE